jgi:hypothetical protein
VEYDANESFTQEQLGGLTPNKLMLWFNDVTFGVSEPPTGHDMNPLSQSLQIPKIVQENSTGSGV